MGMTGAKEMQADIMTQSWALWFSVKHLPSRVWSYLKCVDKFGRRVLCTFSAVKVGSNCALGREKLSEFCLDENNWIFISWFLLH